MDSLPKPADVGAVLILLLLVTFGWSGCVRAEDKVARVGILAPITDDAARQRLYEPFRATLAQRGWVEGKNASYYYRAAKGVSMQFDDAVSELIQLKVDIIYADSAPATRAAYAATRTIPIVALDYTNDPVAAGYARSYAVPGNNLTGFFLDAPQFGAKWLELLQTVIPKLSRVAVVWDPNPGDTHLKAVQSAAQRLGLRLQVLTVRTPSELSPALSTLRGRAQALVILPSPMLLGQSARLGELTAQYGLPATSFQVQFAEVGVLFAYGPDDVEAGERCGLLAARILAGARPGDLPVERPTRFTLAVNLKTAKSLGLNVPEFVLANANRIIR